MDVNELEAYLKNRPMELEQLKSKDSKIVGYFASKYVPEEIIYASGAVPICLAHGGDPYPAEVALSAAPRIICPFARAQVGERLQKENPYYSLVDMLVGPTVCQHLRKATDIWEYYTDGEVFRLGVPHQYDSDFEIEYYAERLKALKGRLEILTGNEITDEKLGRAIELYNRMRELLKKVSLMRKAPHPPISALDFIGLNQASFYADPVFMVEILDSVYQELRQKPQPSDPEMPRLLLVGPNIAYGDYKVLNLVEEAGSNIVIEEICEGIRYYWQGIENKGDPYESLAKGYLRDRVPCAFMASATKKRFDFVMKLIQDFNVSGVIWYQLIYCESYDSESYYFVKKMEERNIPVLVLESDYSTLDTGRVKTRIDAFIEMVKGGIY